MILILVLGFLIILGLFLPLPHPDGRILACLWDMIHAPMVLVLTCIVFRFVRGKQKVVDQPEHLAVSITLLLVLAIEVLQPLFGRSDDLMDVFFSLCGLFLFLVVCSVKKARTVRWKTGVLFFVVLLMYGAPLGNLLLDRARRLEAFPVLATFEQSGEIQRWECHGAELLMAKEGAGAWLIPDGHSVPYPGAFLVEVVPDWSDYSTLVMELFKTSDLHRALNLKTINKMGMFWSGSGKEKTIRIDSIELLR